MSKKVSTLFSLIVLLALAVPRVLTPQEALSGFADPTILVLISLFVLTGGDDYGMRGEHISVKQTGIVDLGTLRTEDDAMSVRTWGTPGGDDHDDGAVGQS